MAFRAALFPRPVFDNRNTPIPLPIWAIENLKCASLNEANFKFYVTSLSLSLATYRYHENSRDLSRLPLLFRLACLVLTVIYSKYGTSLDTHH